MASLVDSMLEKLNLKSGEKRVPAKEPAEDELKELREKYEKAKQEHVFTFYDQLDTEGKAALFEQLQGIDPYRINILADKAIHPPKATEEKKEPSIEPLPKDATASLLELAPEEVEKWYKTGLGLVAQNKVAVVLLAGGQGTRLGSSAPKGCFDIGLPSKKSLFQMQAERIWKIQDLARKYSGSDRIAAVPWYVMTSGPTRAPTQKFFEEHDYFGLPKENVVIFEQGVLPCISNEGKILMETKSKVAVAPDGNGGIYQALITSDARTDMRKRGIEHVHAYCVDNCLAKVADPAFIGFAASKHVDIATKVVRKLKANEPVGLIIQKDGKPDVIEYSEIDKELAEEKEGHKEDTLKFRAANIVQHYYSFEFLDTIQEWAHKLPHHVAKKKIPYIDTETGETMKPSSPNGIKLESFVFDAFNFVPMEKFACMEVDRKEEFSPLKNAEGDDSAATSRRDIMEQGARWAKSAGATVVSETAEARVEISPLVSYAGEGLAYLKGKVLESPTVIEKE